MAKDYPRSPTFYLKGGGLSAKVPTKFVDRDLMKEKPQTAQKQATVMCPLNGHKQLAGGG